MTATQLIYNAWKNTKLPILYKTSNGKGEPIEVECDFMHPENHPNYEKVEGVCTICGGEMQAGIPNKKFFSSNYTDWGRHKNQDGNYVCEACAFTMLLNVQAGRKGLCRYSFVADKNLKICNRSDLRDYIINPPEPPFVMVCAISQKKHLAIKSKITYNSRENYFCMYEEEPVLVNRSQAEEIIKACEALRGIGFTKDEIEKGVIRYDKVKDFRTDCFDKINHLYKSMIGLRIFNLCLHVAQKMTEEEAICYLGLTPKTKKQHQEPCLSMQSTKAGTHEKDRPDWTCGDKLNDLQDERQSEQLTFQSS